MVLWTVDTEDYAKPGVATIVHSALAGARPGAVILMHDAGGDRRQTIAALPQIVQRLRARGYKLVTIPRLVLDDPPPGQNKLRAPRESCPSVVWNPIKQRVARKIGAPRHIISDSRRPRPTASCSERHRPKPKP